MSLRALCTQAAVWALWLRAVAVLRREHHEREVLFSRMSPSCTQGPVPMIQARRSQMKSRSNRELWGLLGFVGWHSAISFANTRKSSIGQTQTRAHRLHLAFSSSDICKLPGATTSAGRAGTSAGFGGDKICLPEQRFSPAELAARPHKPALLRILRQDPCSDCCSEGRFPTLALHQCTVHVVTIQRVM